MIIHVKNKHTLIIDDFELKCCIGKMGSKYNKKEGDYSTPIGQFSLGKLYYRQDRVKKLETKITTRVIKKSMGWCNDPLNTYYNKEILINKKIKHEKLFRKDNLYDYLIVINYNIGKIKKDKGSAIFIHLTKNYKPTAGCVALKKKRFYHFDKINKQ